MPLASLAKLLTIYAAAQVLSPSTPVPMTPTAVADVNDAADIGFNVGETFQFENLARLTLAASSNDGAEAITEAATAAKGEDTTSMLASAAASIGLQQTFAINGTGLDQTSDLSGAYGSVHDIAILAGQFLRTLPNIAEASTQASITETSEQGIAHTFANTDIDVLHIPNLLLSKTGYTDLAGGNLVVVYDAGINHPIAIVVLGSTEQGRFTDVQQLMAATSAYFAGIAPKSAPSSASQTS